MKRIYSCAKIGLAISDIGDACPFCHNLIVCRSYYFYCNICGYFLYTNGKIINKIESRYQYKNSPRHLFVIDLSTSEFMIQSNNHEIISCDILPKLKTLNEYINFGWSKLLQFNKKK